jgi:hypothetical protein
MNTDIFPVYINSIIRAHDMMDTLSDVINQFQAFVADTGINIISDGQGAMDLDTTGDIPEDLLQEYDYRINEYNRDIRTQIDTIRRLIDRAVQVEVPIRDSNESFTSHTLRTIHRLEHLISKFGYYK